MKKRCSCSDYMNLSYEERRQLVNEFLSLIESKYPDSEFGYDSFPELYYDEMVLSSIFHELKEQGHIKSTGYMTFRLTNKKEVKTCMFHNLRTSFVATIVVRSMK
jgi:hypothetical protein